MKNFFLFMVINFIIPIFPMHKQHELSEESVLLIEQNALLAEQKDLLTEKIDSLTFSSEQDRLIKELVASYDLKSPAEDFSYTSEGTFFEEVRALSVMFDKPKGDAKAVDGSEDLDMCQIALQQQQEEERKIQELEKWRQEKAVTRQSLRRKRKRDTKNEGKKKRKVSTGKVVPRSDSNSEEPSTISFFVPCMYADCPKTTSSSNLPKLISGLIVHLYMKHKKIKTYINKHKKTNGAQLIVACPRCGKEFRSSTNEKSLVRNLVQHLCCTSMHNPEEYEEVRAYVYAHAEKQHSSTSL